MNSSQLFRAITAGESENAAFKSSFNDEAIETQSLANVSKSTATRELKELVEKDIFIVEGSKGQGVR